MTAPRIPELAPDKGFMFRITHIDNLPHVLRHGVCCRSHANHNASFTNIGNPELIDKRSRRIIPRPPGGTLSDYAPFYFTPHSIMLRNIGSGRNGSLKCKNDEIVFVLTSVYQLIKDNVPYLFTDQHASTVGAEFFTDPAQLDRIDWPLLRARDFRRDDDGDPGKLVRYQAEGLVHGVLPIDSILAIACHSEAVQARIQKRVDAADLDLRVVCRPGWYF